MKGFKLGLVIIVLLISSPLVMAEAWNNVALADANCAGRVKDNPDGHERACMLKCASAGFVIMTADGQFLKLDEEGNRKAKAFLESSDKADHIRVDVKGERSGDTIKVDSLTGHQSAG